MNKPRKYKRWWVGLPAYGGRGEVFSLPVGEDPSYASKYACCVGPHMTKRGAEFTASPAAVGNPHCRTARDADRIAKEIAEKGFAL